MKPHPFETKNFLAIYWSAAISILLGYIVVRWGQEKEILTLIIGLLSTTIGAVIGYYFGASNEKKHPTTPLGTTTADISATIITDTTEPNQNAQ